MTIVRFTNCRVCENGKLVREKDIVFDDASGKILDAQHEFFNCLHAPEMIIDMQNRIIAPGFMELQINGGDHGFDYSVYEDDESYREGVLGCRRQLLGFGVTSFCPTVVSGTAKLYSHVLSHLRPSFGSPAEEGADILGAHVEGPFISRQKSGCHPLENFREPVDGFNSLENMYGSGNLRGGEDGTIKIVTGAPELSRMEEIIHECARRNIVYSIGHSTSGISEAEAAVRAGAKCVTHLFNAMPPMHHRDPGIIGLIGSTESLPRPYYGIICDNIHIHHSSVKLAYRAHPKGAILVSDAMGFVGCENGLYDWRNGMRVQKRGERLVLEGTDTIAGSAIGLDQCVRNLVEWTAADLPDAVACVTSHPSRLLGLEKRKGFLHAGCDADFAILDDSGYVLQTWKAGKKVHETQAKQSSEKSLTNGSRHEFVD